MRFGRFEHKGKAVYSVVEEDIVYAVEGSIFEEWEKKEAIGRFVELRALVPCEPTKVFGLGLNWKKPGRELQPAPGLFMKPHTALVGNGDPIVVPWMSELVVHEPEMAIVIGKKAKNVPVDQAAEYVFGYTCANDVTARDIQQTDRLRAGRSKIFDTFCPLGPVIATDIDGNDLALCARVNGELGPSGRTSELQFNVEEIVSFISCVVTLLPGDVILSAAPGVGEVKPGDVVEIEVENIGVLRNPVVAPTSGPVRWNRS